MKLRVNKRISGEYFIQKRFLCFWFDCTDEGEIDTLFAEGICKDYDSEKDAIKDMNKLFKEYKDSKEFSKKYDEGVKVDKDYECKYPE